MSGSFAVRQSKTLSLSRCRVERKRGRIRRVGCWLAFPMTLKGFSTDYAPTIQAVAALLALASLCEKPSRNFRHALISGDVLDFRSRPISA